jgi:RNA polymerase subunit RPABC4/transcription elongation factor Spt4
MLNIFTAKPCRRCMYWVDLHEFRCRHCGAYKSIVRQLLTALVVKWL